MLGADRVISFEMCATPAAALALAAQPLNKPEPTATHRVPPLIQLPKMFRLNVGFRVLAASSGVTGALTVATHPLLARLGLQDGAAPTCSGRR